MGFPGVKARGGGAVPDWRSKTEPPGGTGFSADCRDAGETGGRSARGDHRRGGRAAEPHGPHASWPPPPRALAPARSRTLPVLASGDHAVLLGDEQRGSDGVLVALDLAQQHRAAALRPGVDLGRHVRAAASPAGGPSADRRAGTRRLLGATGPRVRHAAVSSRAPPQLPVLPGKAAQT